MEIEAGDIVRQVANDLPMNVRSVGISGIWCTWYDLEGKHHSDVFAPRDLVLMHKLPEGEDRPRSEVPPAKARTQSTG